MQTPRVPYVVFSVCAQSSRQWRTRAGSSHRPAGRRIRTPPSRRVTARHRVGAHIEAEASGQRKNGFLYIALCWGHIVARGPHWETCERSRKPLVLHNGRSGSGMPLDGGREAACLVLTDQFMEPSRRERLESVGITDRTRILSSLAAYRTSACHLLMLRTRLVGIMGGGDSRPGRWGETAFPTQPAARREECQNLGLRMEGRTSGCALGCLLGDGCDGRR